MLVFMLLGIFAGKQTKKIEMRVYSLIKMGCVRDARDLSTKLGRYYIIQIVSFIGMAVSALAGLMISGSS